MKTRKQFRKSKQNKILVSLTLALVAEGALSMDRLTISGLNQGHYQEDPYNRSNGGRGGNSRTNQGNQSVEMRRLEILREEMHLKAQLRMEELRMSMEEMRLNHFSKQREGQNRMLCAFDQRCRETTERLHGQFSEKVLILIASTTSQIMEVTKHVLDEDVVTQTVKKHFMDGESNKSDTTANRAKSKNFESKKDSGDTDEKTFGDGDFNINTGFALGPVGFAASSNARAKYDNHTTRGTQNDALTDQNYENVQDIHFENKLRELNDELSKQYKSSTLARIKGRDLAEMRRVISDSLVALKELLGGGFQECITGMNKRFEAVANLCSENDRAAMKAMQATVIPMGLSAITGFQFASAPGSMPSYEMGNGSSQCQGGSIPEQRMLTQDEMFELNTRDL